MSRCQAIKLMPRSRTHWNGEKDFRCKWNAKEGNFCGVHQQLAEFIHSIEWREEDEEA